jgi:hypothetical protein
MLLMKSSYIVTIFALVIVLFVIPHSVYAQTSCTHYVSPSGNNANTGNSLTQPWKTIQFAFDQITADKTLCIRGGTYPESLILTKSGTSSNRLTVQNYQNEIVKITGAAGIEHVLLLTADYTEIFGLTFERSPSNWPSGYYGWIQIVNGANNNIFRNNSVQITTTDPHTLDMNFR